MAVTNLTIIRFLYAIKSSHSTYMNTNCIAKKIGNKKVRDEYKGFLLGAFVHILEDYFNVVNDEDENFFTYDEIHDILQHFNNIAGTNHYINFENIPED